MLSPANVGEPPPVHAVGLPAKKRRGGGAKAPKKRHRGERKGLLYELKFDELYIIFAYIYPMDLLNLARTCKSLRAILMHKSSSFLWKTALRQIPDLPPCPADLTEPEYTNLVFYNRCHGCGKSAKTILWSVRRRYCPACRTERLRSLTHCDKIFRSILPHNNIIPRHGMGTIITPGVFLAYPIFPQFLVDKDQMDSFMREYHLSSNKTEFLNEKRKWYKAITLHASECENWQQQQGRVHRYDLEILREERRTSIFGRLKQRGYEPEIACFGSSRIEKSFKSAFKKHKPLTDSEWDQMWPVWVKIMNNFHLQRLEVTLYRPRRRLLVSEYDRYVMHADSPTPDFLPHAVDLVRIPLFRNIIRTSEGTTLDDKPFASALAQLPMLANEWLQKLQFEIAELMKIPSFLSSDIVPWGSDTALSNIQHEDGELFLKNMDKLHLACAVFYAGSNGAFAYPEVLSVSVGYSMMFFDYDNDPDITGIDNRPIYVEGDSERAGSLHERFGLQFLDEAPYIVYACGMDPNVATADDMDRRNARLQCLSCDGPTLVMNWRHALWHARVCHCIPLGLAPLSESPRWQLINDEYIDAIQALERSVRKSFPPDWTRCLLCRPRIGDAMMYDKALDHLVQCHDLERGDIREGTHYKLVGIRDVCVVEMVETLTHVIFRVLRE